MLRKRFTTLLQQVYCDLILLMVGFDWSFQAQVYIYTSIRMYMRLYELLTELLNLPDLVSEFLAIFLIIYNLIRKLKLQISI